MVLDVVGFSYDFILFYMILYGSHMMLYDFHISEAFEHAHTVIMPCYWWLCPPCLKLVHSSSARLTIAQSFDIRNLRQ